MSLGVRVFDTDVVPDKLLHPVHGVDDKRFEGMLTVQRGDSLRDVLVGSRQVGEGRNIDG